MARALPALILASWGCVCSASAQPLTVARSDHAAPAGARAVSTADFDRDGRPDIALASAGRNSVTIVLNRQNGLTAVAEVATGAGPFDMVAADVNGDAIPDLAIANADGDTIRILLGRGDGRFDLAGDVAAPSQSPRGLAAGDVDNDGRIDLVYSAYATGVVQVLLGNGAGGFARGPSASLGAVQPQGLATGDFNHDGRLDVAVATAGGLQVLYGNSSGGLTPRAVAGTESLNVVAAVDLDSDGWLDLVALSTAGSEVITCFGSAAGFAAAGHYTTGASPRGLAIADLNQDGWPDLVTANRSASTVGVLLADPHRPRTFLTADEFAAGSGSRDVVAVDVDGDGRIDLATANEYAATTTLLRNTTVLTPAGFSFRSVTVPVASGMTGARPIASADFDRDGQPDLVVERSDLSIAVVTRRATITLPAPFPGGVIGVVDVNADGNPDLLYRGYASDDPPAGMHTRLVAFVGNGRGAFTLSTITDLPIELRECGSGDVNRDARPDLVCGAYDIAMHAQVLQVLLGAGDGRFRRSSETSLSDNGHDVGAVHVADVNRDGVDDVVVLRGDAEIWLGNGAGGLSYGSRADLGAIAWPVSLTVGDLNRDGRSDLVVVGNGGGLGIALGNAGGFGVVAIAPDLAQGTPAIVDLDRDGHADLVVAAYPNERRHQGEDINLNDLPPDPVLVLSGRGDGTFETADGFALGGSFVGVTDLTRDGLPDIVGWSGDRIALLVNQRGDVNRAPVVTAPDRIVNYNDLVVDPLGEFECAFLSASAIDPDLHAVTYEWRDAAGTLVTANRVVRRCDQRPGAYPMELTVRDGRGAVIVRRVTLTILPLKEIVVYATDSTGDDDVWLAGSWRRTADPSAAGGFRAWDPDRGAAKLSAPAANPSSSVRIRFTPDPTQTYKLWVRLKAERNNPSNDSIFVQFTGATDEAGRPVYRVGTTSGLVVNLEECAGCGESNWGWEDDGWGAVGRAGVTLRFPDGGRQDVVIQTREDGVSIDQVVLSAEKYLTARPGRAKDDATILQRNYHQNPH